MKIKKNKASDVVKENLRRVFPNTVASTTIYIDGHSKNGVPKWSVTCKVHNTHNVVMANRMELEEALSLINDIMTAAQACDEEVNA